MLRHNRHSSLEYLRPSPVRGQLEPPDPRTAKGWRYLQTTDTLDELKVLLPPNTASIYEQLLKLETLELGKKAVSWDRLLEIRHLKDRMIRKCQKLSKSPPTRRIGQGDPFTFQTLVAPADFRLKEMEKWFRQQQIRISLGGTQRPPTHAHAARGPPYVSNSRHSPQPKVKSHPLVVDDPLTDEPEPILSPSPPKAISPEPLPHLLRSSMAMALMNQNSLIDPVDSAPRSSSITKIETTTHKLRHQRSCIKRTNTGDSMKTVSWADEQDLLERAGKFTNATKEAQDIGKPPSLGKAYVNHMQQLEGLEQQVQDSLQRLRLESDGLQRVCTDIQEQKKTLREVVGRFSQKQSDYRAKVQEVLNEADGLLALCRNKEPQSDPRPRFMPSIDEDSREEPTEPVIE
ncbi:hypothetical protein D9757_005328 [Collybiopsis confluens]|uniref:Uncharacterized protein n=1 Tax=Collybiopsis confluens TaxID=2823264 RepID=A0A8H5M9F9_9AGAR|nr:hypothetical protein D9757_005328 [Collybiopsis confluens]